MASKAELPPEAYSAMMDQYLRKQDQEESDVKLTAEEAEKFRKSFQDAEFRKMFAEYMDEISDPKHRAETDLYISQLEGDNQVPEGKELIKPRAVFVVKTRMNVNPKKDPGQSEKLFVNVVESEKIAAPTSQRAAKGTNWSIPLSVGPKRLERDKGGATVATFDACFHPDAIQLGRAHRQFKDLICNTALDQVEGAMRNMRGNEHTQVSHEYHVLRGVPYKNGEPTFMMVAKDKLDEPKAAGLAASLATAQPPSASTTKAMANGASKATANGASAANKPRPGSGGQPAVKGGFLLGGKGKSKGKNAVAAPSPMDALTSIGTNGTAAPNNGSRVRPRSPRTSGVQELPDSIRPQPPSPSRSKPAAATAAGPARPNHSIKERGEFRPSDHMNERVQQPRRPKELVVTVELPLMPKASLMDLDVSDKRFLLTAKEIYRLDLQLPYPVIGEKGAARFDKVKRTLTVTIPVQPPPLVPASTILSTPPSSEDATAPCPAPTAAPTTGAPVPPAPEEPSAAAEEPLAFADKSKKTTSGSVPRPKRDTDHNRWLDAAPRPPRMTFERPPPAPEEASKSAEAPPGPPAAADEATAAGKAADAPPPKPLFRASNDFTESAGFAGACPGYVFKLGPSGIGYYADVREQRKLPAAERPEFEWAQTDITVTLLVQVPNIDPASVRASFTNDKVSVAFSAGEGDAPQRYEHAFRPRHAIDAARCRFDVQHHNMIVVLFKSLPQGEDEQYADAQIWDDLALPDEPPTSPPPPETPAPTAAPSAAALAASVQEGAPAPAAASAPPPEATSAAAAVAPTQFSNSLIFELD